MKKSDREVVFNKYGGKCAYCGHDLKKGWHVDHLKSVGRNWQFITDENGKRIWDADKHQWIKEMVMDNPENDCLENYMPACASCNILKHSQSIEGFRSSISQFINSLNSYINQYKIAKRYGLIEETNKPVIFYFEQIDQ